MMAPCTLLVTNLTREGATLFRGNGKGLFEDVTSRDGLAAPTFGFTGFGTSWFDYDNDGRLDLFIANGAVTIVESLRGQPYPYGQSNLLFHDEGQQRFSRHRATLPDRRSSASTSAVAWRSATSTTTGLSTSS